MRKQLLGLFVPLLAFVLIADAADITGKGVAKKRPLHCRGSRSLTARTDCGSSSKRRAS